MRATNTIIALLCAFHAHLTNSLTIRAPQTLHDNANIEKYFDVITYTTTDCSTPPIGKYPSPETLPPVATDGSLALVAGFKLSRDLHPGESITGWKDQDRKNLYGQWMAPPEKSLSKDTCYSLHEDTGQNMRVAVVLDFSVGGVNYLTGAGTGQLP